MISINIKKRTILSVVIIVIILIATFKYWFIFGAVPVNMDVAGQGICNIEVLLNKKDNDAFNKIQTDKVEINLDESNHASLYIKNLGNYIQCYTRKLTKIKKHRLFSVLLTRIYLL